MVYTDTQIRKERLEKRINQFLNRHPAQRDPDINELRIEIIIDDLNSDVSDLDNQLQRLRRAIELLDQDTAQ